MLNVEMNFGISVWCISIFSMDFVCAIDFNFYLLASRLSKHFGQF